MNTRIKLILIGSLLIIGVYLILEHRIHILGYSQYILFALFIAMHFFMHGSHGGHNGQKKGEHRHE
jgi:predicted tellurium resistance membrane protein TerC